jgi:hypothetical protein
MREQCEGFIAVFGLDFNDDGRLANRHESNAVLDDDLFTRMLRSQFPQDVLHDLLGHGLVGLVMQSINSRTVFLTANHTFKTHYGTASGQRLAIDRKVS